MRNFTFITPLWYLFPVVRQAKGGRGGIFNPHSAFHNLFGELFPDRAPDLCRLRIRPGDPPLHPTLGTGLPICSPCRPETFEAVKASHLAIPLLFIFGKPFKVHYMPPKLPGGRNSSPFPFGRDHDQIIAYESFLLKRWKRLRRGTTSKSCHGGY